jgi:hypothetical protein
MRGPRCAATPATATPATTIAVKTPARVIRVPPGFISVRQYNRAPTAVSPDETFVTIAAIVLGPVLWAVWLFKLWRLQLRAGRRTGLGTMSLTLGACALLIFIVLRTLASFDVVDAPPYLFMYVVLGLAWLRLTISVFPLLGLSVRDDVVERDNFAATLAGAGALGAVTLCYAGGNIGDGPGWWVVIFSAGLATGTWLLIWFVLAFFSPVADTVTIDRDPAAGLRLGAFLVSVGLVFGRAVAGDWVSSDATVNDFVYSLPAALLLLAVALVIEYRARPTPERPHAPFVQLGMVPAAVYLTVAVAAVARLGQP